MTMAAHPIFLSNQVQENRISGTNGQYQAQDRMQAREELFFAFDGSAVIDRR